MPTIRKTTNLPGMQRAIAALPNHSQLSTKAMLEYYCEKIMMKHFGYAAAKSRGYPKLDPRYAARKFAKYGKQPILVASGFLRDSATTRYRVFKKSGKYTIELRIPEYGKYVIEQGRDWFTPSKRDEKDMMRFWKQDLFRRRRIFLR